MSASRRVECSACGCHHPVETADGAEIVACPMVGRVVVSS